MLSGQHPPRLGRMQAGLDSGQWTVVGGQIVSCQSSVVGCRWSVAGGRWSVAGGDVSWATTAGHSMGNEGGGNRGILEGVAAIAERRAVSARVHSHSVRQGRRPPATSAKPVNQTASVARMLTA
jgi:hypothetical protein